MLDTCGIHAGCMRNAPSPMEAALGLVDVATLAELKGVTRSWRALAQRVLCSRLCRRDGQAVPTRLEEITDLRRDQVNAVLTNLDLSLNKIGDEGAKAIADSLKSGMAVVTTLYLGYNSIGDEGAIVIAEALKINAVVTKLWPGLETE